LQIRTSHPKTIWKAKTVLGEGTLSGSLFKVKINLKGKKPVSFKTLHSAF
jgi:hypothetical protein